MAQQWSAGVSGNLWRAFLKESVDCLALVLRTSVKYPAMGVARYCWSVVVLLSEMMYCRDSEVLEI